MRFLDAWRELPVFDLVRLLGPLGLMVGATFLPGRRVARVAALCIALSVPFLRELAVDPKLGVGWMLLWIVVAWMAGGDETLRSGRASAPPVLEAGTIGLLLALVLLGLLLAAVARQDMSPEEARRASWGAAFVGLGLLHLMMRRHLRRAAVAFAALGMGLQVLDGAARGSLIEARATPSGVMLLASAIAAAMVLRLARGRERYAGSGWVSDAHDLHD